MRACFVVAFLLVGLLCVSAVEETTETQVAQELNENPLNEEEISEADLDIDDHLYDASTKVNAIGKALGGKDESMREFVAPAIVPRSSLREFGREIARIKKKLTDMISQLRPRLTRMQTRIADHKLKIDILKKKIAEIKKRMKKGLHDEKDELSKKYAAQIKTLEKRLKEYKKSRKWLKALKGKVSTLNSAGNPGSTKYDTTLASVKKSLADSAENIQITTDIDVVPHLQELELTRSNLDMNTLNDLDMQSLKLYETDRLHKIAKTMLQKLDKKIADIKKQIKDLHKKKAHRLHLGLKRLQNDLKLLQKRLKADEAEFSKLRKYAEPRISGAERELKKIKRIEDHLYTAGGNP